MYNREVWDDIYMKHINDAPWLTNSCFQLYSPVIDVYLPKHISGMHILDYGCGNGKIANRLRKKGAVVDLAEISHIMVERLCKNYFGKMDIYEVEHPGQIAHKVEYDIILAWMLFCNICPDFWNIFLDEFYDLLKPESSLIIGGWDQDDPINKKNNNIVMLTGYRNWSINNLIANLDGRFEVAANDIVPIKFPFYEITRIIRCFKLIKL